MTNRISKISDLIKGKLFFFIPVSIILWSGCQSGKKDQATLPPVHLVTSRFDLDLYALDTNHIGDGLEKLNQKYPDFLNFFLDTLMGMGIKHQFVDTVTGIRTGLKVYLTYKDFVQLEDTIRGHYPDTKKVEEMLTPAFQRMKSFFPGYHIPKIYYLNTELNNLPAFTLDTQLIGISLDMFLGDNFLPYTQVQIPAYLFPHLRPSYIPVSVFKVIYSSNYPFVQEDKVLLDLMLQRGKEYYFLHQVLPETPDSVIFGFTQKQVDWCSHNESFIYNYFIHQNLLYQKELMQTLPYINDGPFARGIGSSADPDKLTPGNIGSWLGYKIVTAYMSQHTHLGLKEMLDQKTAPDKFLEEAKYKPK